MKTPVLTMSGVAVYRGGRPVLNIDELNVDQGEILSIIGPNGAGKSTLLHAVNLLLPYSSGKLALFGQPVSAANQLLLRRRSALLFQEALFTRDTVLNNVVLPLRLRGCNRQEAGERALQALETVRCRHLTSRQAQSLSGGEAQRVSLARALVTEPELLLLDEPFSALDPATRDDMLAEFRQIIMERGITALVVSHIIDDILFLSERTLVLEQGRIIQQGKPEEILRRPASEAVARLTGMDNIIACRTEKAGSGTRVILNNSVEFLYPGQLTRQATCCCIPGDIFAIGGPDGTWPASHAALEGSVLRVIPGIGVYQVVADIQGLTITARLPRQQALAAATPGSAIWLTFNPEDIQLL